MRIEVNNTLNNVGVRFIKEGFEETYPFIMGASGIAGLSGALIAFEVTNNLTTTADTNKATVANAHYHGTQANQLEGAAEVFSGPLVAVLAVSAVTASIMRAKRALNKNSPET